MVATRPRRFRTFPTTPRTQRWLRPGLEALEGRALLAAPALDPTFGTGGIVLGSPDTGSGPQLSDVTAVAVQPDGKIITAGTFGFNNATNATITNNETLALRRTNADGSVDTTFGTNGQVTIPVPDGTYVSGGPSSVVITPGGAIDLSVTLISDSPLPPRTTTSLVAQVTAAGQLDPGFGTNGEFVLPAGDSVGTIAVQGDGKVVGSGFRTTTNASGSNSMQLLAFRLTTAGAFDPSFNTTGEQVITVSARDPGSTFNLFNALIAVAPGGQIDLGFNLGTYGAGNVYDAGGLARVNSDGSLDTTFGSGGTELLTVATLTSIAVQADNKIIVAGPIVVPAAQDHPFLARYLASGAADTTFRGGPTHAEIPDIRDGTFESVVVASTGIITVGGLTSNQINGVSQSPSLLVEQFRADGSLNVGFGVAGRLTIAPPTPPAGTQSNQISNAVVALGPMNKIIAAASNTFSSPGTTTSQSLIARLLPIATVLTATDDFDANNRSDIAAELANLGEYAIRHLLTHLGDTVQQFGQAGVGASIPVSGDFDDDGISDVAVYLPSLGEFAYRPSSGGNDVVVQFGPAGTGASIPCPGDYFGTGTTAMAVYIPSQGNFAIRGPNGVGNVLVPFGIKGAGQSIPAPGDYDGDGVTDLAVYIPAQGILAYRPSSGGPDVKVGFGSAGPGASIPAPGDYDGDGKTDVAVYIPSQGQFAVHPSSHAANYYIPFGMPGAGDSIPAPGDYDGDGKTDAAVYLPGSGEYAYRPSSGGNDVVEGFGQADAGRTVPTTSIPYAFPPVPPVATNNGPASAAVLIPLTDDLTNPTSLTTKKTKTSGVGLA